MRINPVTVVTTIILLVTIIACQSPGNDTGQLCDRDCLNGFIDQYLEAIQSHDPSLLPLTESVKFTENGQRLMPGDGLWNTLSETGSYKLYIADPEAGQAGFFGTIRENGTPAILALRLKIEKNKISEIETIVARDEEGALNLEKLGGPHSSFLDTIPVSEHASREELIRIANMYFTGLECNNGKGTYPFTENCNRIENGKQTTNNPSDWSNLERPDSLENVPMVDINALGCKEQFEKGFFRFVSRIRDRRFVAIDQERGLVLTFVFFDHAGNIPEVTLSDGTTIPIGVSRPFTWEISELFKIENGLIRQIEAVLGEAPYGMNSGWSSWEDGLSSQPKL